MKGRIGLTAVLVAALMALGASPASAASKKAGTITAGNSVTVLNTSGFAKITITCHSTAFEFAVQGVGGGLDLWRDVKSPGEDLSSHFSIGSGNTSDISVLKPGHIEWSVSRGSKVAFGEVYWAETGVSGHDCLYTSQVS